MAEERKCPQDCYCSKHDYENRVREKPDTLDDAVLWVTTKFPYPPQGYTASEMKKRLEELGWDFPLCTWLDVYDAMKRVLGEPTRREMGKL